MSHWDIVRQDACLSAATVSGMLVPASKTCHWIHFHLQRPLLKIPLSMARHGGMVLMSSETASAVTCRLSIRRTMLYNLITLRSDKLSVNETSRSDWRYDSVRAKSS